MHAACMRSLEGYRHTHVHDNMVTLLGSTSTIGTTILSINLNFGFLARNEKKIGIKALKRRGGLIHEVIKTRK